MLRSVLLVCCIAAALTAVDSNKLELTAWNPTIQRSPALTLGASTRALDGLISCGSAGNIRDVRFEGCGRTPCETVVGNTYRIEVDLIPSRPHERLNLAIDLFTNSGVEPILNGEIPDSAVAPGTQYTFGFTIGTTGAFMGPANILFRVYGSEESDELCFIVGVNVVTP